jgi:hypothetical protein
MVTWCVSPNGHSCCCVIVTLFYTTLQKQHYLLKNLKSAFMASKKPISRCMQRRIIGKRHFQTSALTSGTSVWTCPQLDTASIAHWSSMGKQGNRRSSRPAEQKDPQWTLSRFLISTQIHGDDQAECRQILNSKTFMCR